MNPQPYFSWSYRKDCPGTDGRPAEKVDRTMNVAPRQPSSPAVGSTVEGWAGLVEPCCWRAQVCPGRISWLSSGALLKVVPMAVKAAGGGCPGRGPYGLRSLLPGGMWGRDSDAILRGQPPCRIRAITFLTLGLWPSGPICPSPGVNSSSKASWSIFATLSQVTQRFFIAADLEPKVPWSPSLPDLVHQPLLPALAQPRGPI